MADLDACTADRADEEIVAGASAHLRRVAAVIVRTFGADESVNGWAWAVIDAEAVVAAGPNRQAIRHALLDSGCLQPGMRVPVSAMEELLALTREGSNG
jgi:hypothetical protein